MKVIGLQDRNDIELDPVEAYRRARKLDLWLKGLPWPRGVTRGSAAVLASQADAHMLLAARRINPQP